MMSAILIFLICTVTFVTLTYVKPVWWSISLTNPMITNCCRLINGNLPLTVLSVNDILIRYVSSTAANATCKFVHCVFLRETTNNKWKLIFWNTSEKKRYHLKGFKRIEEKHLSKTSRGCIKDTNSEIGSKAQFPGFGHSFEETGRSRTRQNRVIVNDMQCKMEIMDFKHLAAIDQPEKQINQSIYKITQVILDLQNLLDSNDASLITEYTSRIEEFKNCSLQFNVIYRHLYPRISKEQIYQQFRFFFKTIYNIPNQVDCWQRSHHKGRHQWSCNYPSGGANTIC